MHPYFNYKKIGILANKLEDAEIQQIVAKLKKYGIEKCSKTDDNPSTMLLINDIKELANLNYDNCILILLPGVHNWDNNIFIFRRLIVVGFTISDKYETIIKINNWNVFNCDKLKIKSVKIDIAPEEDHTHGAIMVRNNKSELQLKDIEIENVNPKLNTYTSNINFGFYLADNKSITIYESDI